MMFYLDYNQLALDTWASSMRSFWLLSVCIFGLLLGRKYQLISVRIALTQVISASYLTCTVLNHRYVILGNIMNIRIDVVDVLLDWQTRVGTIFILFILPTLVIGGGSVAVALLLLNLDDAQVQHWYLYLVRDLDEFLLVA